MQNAPKGKIEDAIADEFLADSFEFENSDDLNNIISKYENLLEAKPKVP